MMNIQSLVKNQIKENVPELRAGQVIRVHEKIKEGSRERIQVFEGLVIAVKHGRGLDGTFTVRKIGIGHIGVERVFPVHLPAIQKIEILRQEKVRRAKLYYVRGQVGKKVKRRKAEIKGTIYDFSIAEEKKEVPKEEISEEKAPKEEIKEESVPKEQDSNKEEVKGETSEGK